MKAVFWIIKIALFLLALTFAVKNTELVTVRYYLGAQWQGPLILVILVVFCVGVAAGVVASLGPVLRMRAEVKRLRRQEETAATDKVPRAATSATSAAGSVDAV